MILDGVTRKQAFVTHLLVSAVVFMVLLYLIAFEWYPSFYFMFDHGYVGTAVIFFVDVVLGPGLTLLIFKPGKKSLRFDMSIIVILQIVALAWGIKSVYEDRSALTVFYYGQFNVLSQSGVPEVDMKSISGGVSGKQNLVILKVPDSLQERRKFWFEALAHNSSEIYYYGELFEPVNDANIQRILSYSLDIDEVAQENATNADKLREYINEYSGYQVRYYFYPLIGRFNKGVAVFSPEEGVIIDVLDISTKVIAKRYDMNAVTN